MRNSFQVSRYNFPAKLRGETIEHNPDIININTHYNTVVKIRDTRQYFNNLATLIKNRLNKKAIFLCSVPWSRTNVSKEDLGFLLTHLGLI